MWYFWDNYGDSPKKCVFLQTSLLYIVGELAKGGSMAVAVAVAVDVGIIGFGGTIRTYQEIW